jgi:plasminogen activator inhibitor 1 RNA-binding protein
MLPLAMKAPRREVSIHCLCLVNVYLMLSSTISRRRGSWSW